MGGLKNTALARPSASTASSDSNRQQEEVKEERPSALYDKEENNSDYAGDSDLEVSFSSDRKAGGASILMSVSADATGEAHEGVLNPSDEWMINPRNRFRMTWDIGFIMPFLVYLAVMMPFRMCFVNEAKQFTAVYWLEFMIDMCFLLDVVFSFRTGYFVASPDSGGAEEEQEVEYDRWRVALVYFKSWFVLDVISGIPFALIELLASSDPGALKSLKVLKLLRFLKLGRLLKFEKIISNLDRDSIDSIADVMQNTSTRTGVVIWQLSFALCYSCHLMACGWVLVGRYASDAGSENWLANELKGPFESLDTTGEKGEGAVSSIYIASFYFCLTTATSVGYGDILATNDAERVYVIFMEFVGAYIFAMIIGFLTTVVMLEDVNSRNKADQLDAVASFVQVRKFPESLGRRIRRHFRQYYTLKSAINEAKIFNELSTSLRKEVSEFLVTELLGPDSFFATIPTNIWSRLLPILRPMGFEDEECICRQHEDCTDFYAVISGRCVGSIGVPTEAKPRERRITMGMGINQLYLLGVWHECLETVVCKTLVETYAVSAVGFGRLFPGKMDQQNLAVMKQREVLNYKMVPAENSDFGRPLHFTCFTTVQLEVLQAQGIGAGGGGGGSGSGNPASPSGQQAGEYWFTCELVDAASGQPLVDDRSGTHKSAPGAWRPRAPEDSAPDGNEVGAAWASVRAHVAGLLEGDGDEHGWRELSEGLRRLDHSGRGHLEPHEFAQALELMGVQAPVGRRLARAVIRSVDLAGAGTFDLGKFEAAVRSVRQGPRSPNFRVKSFSSPSGRRKTSKGRSSPGGGVNSSVRGAALGSPSSTEGLIAGAAGALSDSCGVVRFGEEVRWMDATAAFGQTGVRVSLFTSERKPGASRRHKERPVFVAGAVIPLTALKGDSGGGGGGGSVEGWFELCCGDSGTIEARLAGRPIPTVQLRARVAPPNPQTPSRDRFLWRTSSHPGLDSRAASPDPIQNKQARFPMLRPPSMLSGPNGSPAAGGAASVLAEGRASTPLVGSPPPATTSETPVRPVYRRSTSLYTDYSGSEASLSATMTASRANSIDATSAGGSQDLDLDGPAEDINGDVPADGDGIPPPPLDT